MKISFNLLVRIGFFLLIPVLMFIGCDKNNNPSNIPIAKINITIEPNSTLYQELNVVSGWTYLGYSDGVNAPSRGIIVYRFSTDQFMAYERTPHYLPDSCCTIQGGFCTSLIVDQHFPFVVDTCTQSKYLIMDGSPSEGPSPYPLIMYQTIYDGQLLYIYN
jgi:hypothetical protein